MKLIMLGAPGSGKGTQAKFITKKYGLPQISTGDLLRDAVKRETVLGIKAKEFLNTGTLVPDEIVLELLKERLLNDDCSNGFILDGYPRNLAQAKQLANITTIDLVVNIEVDYSLLVTRITGRRTCKKCGAIFHLEFNPPKQENVCDKCSEELFQRADDNEEIVKKRLETYENQTKPLIEHYSKQDILKTLISDGTIDEMRLKVIKLLEASFPQ
ncbi:MAG: adenylate kinase [Candidatus Heimdallarchaeota archaeon]|nr:adenylate kinase [Candidatus Heimdallarchaeota archaeon]